MNRLKVFSIAVLASASIGAMAVPAVAEQAAVPAVSAAASIKAGATVYDTAGGEVGTIESVAGDLAVVSTGTTKASLPFASFAAGAKGPVIAMTRDQLNAAASGAQAQAQQQAQADAQAKLKAQLTAGAEVKDPAGGSVGKIEAVEGEFATVATANSKVRLPVTAFAAGAAGPVIAMTAAELDAAAKGSANN